MQLRYFEALHDIASERSSTIVFPLPMDLLEQDHGRGDRDPGVTEAPAGARNASALQ